MKCQTCNRDLDPEDNVLERFCDSVCAEESDGREPECCPECLGQGYVVTCIDDICAGSDHCMHGDGEDVCPECDGRGEV